MQALLFFLPGALYAQTVGLVLSGGGVRGFSHIGVIKALEENNIPIDYITGTSAGALVGSSYAIGRSPQLTEKIFTSDQFRRWGSGEVDESLLYYFPQKADDPSWITLRFAYDSLLKTKLPGSITNSTSVDFELMENYSTAGAHSKYNFDSLLVPFRCVAADIKSKKQVVFRDGDLALAVRSSMAFPLYFSPITIDNRILFDGGLYNNFPVDVMASEFNPDIIIGVNGAGDPEVAAEDNVLSQVKNILVATQKNEMPSEKDIYIQPDINSISVFDFSKAQASIDSGYAATMRMMDLIRSRISRRVTPEELRQKRQSFLRGQPPVFIDKIHVIGLNKQQANYCVAVLNPHNECISLQDFKTTYFRLAADGNIRFLFPKLVYNPVSNYYDLYLYARQEKDLQVDIGGNFSSKPINQAFIGLQYNLLGRQSIRVNANSHFGKLYNAGQVSLRLDSPGKLRFAIEPSYSLSRFDYFKSNSTFFEDVKPSYLISTENDIRISLSAPVRNKAVIHVFGSYINDNYEYYQSQDFSKADTSDQTLFNAYSTGITMLRTTLNRKMYATSGTLFSIRSRHVTGREKYVPGSTSPAADTLVRDLRWMQLHVQYDNYFKHIGNWALGFYGDFFLSSQPFFANYTASVLASPQFSPVPESQTLFLPNFRGYNYIGMGLKNIFSLNNALQFRLEGYLFQPFQEVNKREDNRAEFTDLFLKRYFMATSALVYQSPVGPMSIALNFFDKRDKPFSILFHFGYILFNRRSLD